MKIFIEQIMDTNAIIYNIIKTKTPYVIKYKKVMDNYIQTYV